VDALAGVDRLAVIAVRGGVPEVKGVGARQEGELERVAREAAVGELARVEAADPLPVDV